MSTNQSPDETDQSAPNEATADHASDQSAVAELQGRIEILQEENRRLRREYVRARQTRYRRTAVGFGVIGALAVIGGVILTDSREVLFALGGTGLLAGVLTYYLTPEEFVAATVGETLAQTLQESYEAIQSALDLQGQPVYVPLSDGTASETRLFVPQHHEYSLPDEPSLRQPFVVPEEPSQRGVSFQPTGQRLLEEFRTASDIADTTTPEPERVFDQLADGLVEQFELAESISTTINADRQCVIAVTGSRYGQLDGLDHPIVSFVATGAAVMFDKPTRVTVRTTDDRDFVFECRWGDPNPTADESPAAA